MESDYSKSQLNMKRYGLLGVHDTGAPGENKDYITLVIIHGFSWHSGLLDLLSFKYRF
jgi:hypothetical protein